MTDINKLRTKSVNKVIDEVGVAKAIGIKHVASLLFTYRCTIACKHCLFNCSPRQPEVYVSFEDGVEFLRQLRKTDRVIHIAGGEAMMYYEHMLKICQNAKEQEFAPHFFETNASWCTDDDVTRRRYKELKRAGMLGVLISADPFHQAFVPPERRLRAYKWAIEIYGEENVAAGNLSIEELNRLREVGRDEKLLAEYTRKHIPRLVGRAGNELSRFVPDKPIEELVNDSLWHGRNKDGKSCRTEFDPYEMWEIHIDLYGNIQTCCGIIIGNAYHTELTELMKQGFHTKNELVKIVYEQGPFGLLELAVERGYHPRSGYPQKCYFCWDIRKFLRPYFPDTFGPAEIYV